MMNIKDASQVGLLDMHDQAALVRAGDLSASELVETAIVRAEALDPAAPLATLLAIVAYGRVGRIAEDHRTSATVLRVKTDIGGHRWRGYQKVGEPTQKYGGKLRSHGASLGWD